MSIAKPISINRYGSVALETSPKDCSVSPMVTTRLTPNGGVKNPTCAITIAMIPKWIRLILKLNKAGRSSGAKITSSDMMSRKQPAMIRKKSKAEMNNHFAWIKFPINSVSMAGICWVVKNHEKAIAQAIRKASVPARVIESANTFVKSFSFSFL